MKDQNTPDARQLAILNSARTAFSTYGFRKTSMDDIARGAGISRPALYLHYKNKDDIFQSLSTEFYVESVAKFEAALTRSGPVSEVLEHAFWAKLGNVVDLIVGSPHGQELLDIKHTSAAEVVAEGEARLADILSNWLERQAELGLITLPAPGTEVAQICLAALKTLMISAPTTQDFATGMRTLCKLLGDGLTHR